MAMENRQLASRPIAAFGTVFAVLTPLWREPWNDGHFYHRSSGRGVEVRAAAPDRLGRQRMGRFAEAIKGWFVLPFQRFFKLFNKEIGQKHPFAHLAF